MSTFKLNVLLGKTDSLATAYKSALKDYGKFFSTKQGAFQGVKKTYSVREGMVDDPSKRGHHLVQTTVKEKFDWFRSTAKEYVDALFSQEATNASGTAKAVLVVKGQEWGEFTSLELLRLKSLLENNDLYSMLSNIPVRSDSEEWEPCTEEAYTDRAIFQSPLMEGIAKTTVKESYILPDPNIKDRKDLSGYTPQVAQKSETVDVADYTVQKFSGELSQRERANILKRQQSLLTAVTVALKECNEAEVRPSDLTSDKIFGFLFDGEQS